MRPAAFAAAGWYEADPAKLEEQVAAFLDTPPCFTPDAAVDPATFLGVIGPHAGLRYSGPTAGTAYRHLVEYLAPVDPSDTAAVARAAAVKRVVLMGLSHRLGFDGVAVSSASAFASPLGTMQVDTAAAAELIAALRATGSSKRSWLPFSGKSSAEAVPVAELTVEQEAAEHSLELHTPFIAFALKQRRQRYPNMPPVKLLPIMVGQTRPEHEAIVGAGIRKLFLEPASPGAARESLLCVSSDFCHWGGRFGYQHEFDVATEIPKTGAAPPQPVGRFAVPPSASEIAVGHRIAAMDHEAMAAIAAGDPAAWDDHLGRTRNTVCGRRPIGCVLRGVLATGFARCRFLHYDQSSFCRSRTDSSVSYAAAVMHVSSQVPT